MLQKKLGRTLPSIATICRNIGSQKTIQEGKSRFDELVHHLREWKAPSGVHIQLDDASILQRIVYDPSKIVVLDFAYPLKMVYQMVMLL